MDYDQLIRRMKHIYRNYKEGVLQLQSEIAKDCNRAGNAIRELLPYKEAIERMGEFGRLFLEYTGCPRGHIGRSGGVSLTEEAVIMPVITDVDGGKWRPVKEDVLRDLFSRAVAEKERAEKAEKERDAAIKRLRETCWCDGCKHSKGLDGCQLGSGEECSPRNDRYKFAAKEE